ncbi:hypothetical protein BRC82_03180 [Halobacteriales archaeon QS_1_67_19]|nr:MAG: hypothetical protein BRC82_03180 [Halobacteriales archaeon QS_1_67_19]
MSDAIARSVSWGVGPADSRAVRALRYLVEGVLGGTLLAVSVAVARSALLAAVAGEWWLLGLLAVFAGPFLRLIPIMGKLRRSNERQRTWAPEWAAVRQWRWSVGIAALVGAAFLAVELRTSWVSTRPRAILVLAPTFAAVCSVAARVLSSNGAVDLESPTLTARRYGDRREIDLRNLTRVRTFELGRTTLVWLSLVPGVEKRTAKQGLYAVPTRTLDRVRSAFEAGLAADPTLDPDAIERGRFLRRVNRVAAAAVFAVAVGAVAVLAWFGNLLPWLFPVAFGVGALGIFRLKLAA